ncbi:interferon-induced protein 44-like [Ruditapes philippinarum]|uniref:interferon-induced protein 44-like n=1 Tax=Ruditapes philippinarum TaxID=129788 RepID=UPI00295B1BFF|nr:interferon-induced protein 44-like [Ruditapes philippinarum]
MGTSESKQSVTYEYPLTDKPWREPSNWNSQVEQALIEDIKKIKPKSLVNILLSGPVGAGKSSFISAIFTICDGEKSTRAKTGGSGSSYTVKYSGYLPENLLENFVFRDTMGIEPSDGIGFHVDDFIYLVKGHIANNYTFNPASKITTDNKSFRKEPEPMDVISCVIFVISAKDIYYGIPYDFIRKIGQLQDNLRLEDIPRTLILTQADRLCDQVRENIKNMFRSKKIEKAVRTASEIFHIDQASIHPVVNYEVDYTLTPENNIPLLLALKQSLKYANDRLKQIESAKKIR